MSLTDDTSGHVALVAFEDGSILNEAATTAPRFSTADGCTIASRVATGYQVTSPDSVATVDVEGFSAIVGLSPDGAKIAFAIGDRLALADIATGSDTIDLGPTGRTVEFSRQ